MSPTGGYDQRELLRRELPGRLRLEGIEIDIALYADVLRRHRTIVIVGCVLTLMLVFLSYVRVAPSGISYRSPEIWSNQATLVLTQAGAPELRSVLPTNQRGNSSLADTGRFAGLIDVYATMATSDPVVQVLEDRRLIDKKDMESGKNPVSAAAVVSTVGGGTTPMMTISGKAKSAAQSTALTLGATRALLEYVRTQQAAARIPVNDRIQLRVVKASEEPTLLKPRSKALPILVLLGGLIATAALAFTRDNLSRSGATAASNATGQQGESDGSGAADESQRSADTEPAAAMAKKPAELHVRSVSHRGSAVGGRRTLGSVPRQEPLTEEDAVADERSVSS